MSSFWRIFNVSGFYRINYDEKNWEKIIKQLATKKDAIPTRNRAQLINDAFSFAQAKLLDPTKPFEIIKYMSTESDYLPWRTLISRLAYSMSILRAPQDTCDAEWEHADEQYRKETDANLKSELQTSMACTRFSSLISHFLSDQLNKEIVRSQDALSGIRAVATKPEGNSLAWYFVKANWQEIFSRYGSTSQFPALIADLTSRFNTQRQLDDFNHFFEKNTNQGSATREVQLSRDRIRANINWISSSVEAITKWLNENN